MVGLVVAGATAEGSGSTGGSHADSSMPLEEGLKNCKKLVTVVESVLWLPRNYSIGIETLYYDTVVDPSTIKDNQKCDSVLDKIKDSGFSTATLELTSLMSLMFDDLSQDIAQNITVVLSDTPVSEYKSIYLDAIERCRWMSKFLTDDRKKLLQDFRDSTKLLGEVESSYDQFREHLLPIKHILTQNLARVASGIAWYRLGNMSKLQLSAELHTLPVSTGVEDLLRSGTELDNLGWTMEHKLTDTKHHLHKAFKKLFLLQIPVLNGQTIASLHFLDAARNINENTEVLYANFSQDYAEYMRNIIDVTIDTVIQRVRALRHDLVYTIEDGGTAILAYAQKLLLYEQQSEMTQEFYM